MVLSDVLSRLDFERRNLVRDGEVAEVLEDVVRLRGDDHSWHTIIWSSLDEHSADAAIAREVAYHESIGAEFEWKLYAHDTPAGLQERLQRHGFEVGPREAVMVYDLSQGPLPAAGDCRVGRVDTLEQVAVFKRVAEQVFGKDYSFTADQLSRAIASGSTQHRAYVVYAADGMPAGIGRLYTHPSSHFAGLYGGGTISAYRRQGVYRASIAARQRDAVDAAARYLLVDALPTSRPILERLGFHQLTETWPCQWRPSSSS